MTSEHRKYFLVETLISFVINSGLSLSVAWIVFHRQALVDLWGPSGLAMDFLPQTFMVALMSTLVPGYLTRRRLRAAKVAPLQGPASKLPRNLVLRSILVAVVTTVVFGGIAIVLASTFWGGPMTTKAVYVLKVIYGATISVPITLVALRAALSERQKSRR